MSYYTKEIEFIKINGGRAPLPRNWNEYFVEHLGICFYVKHDSLSFYIYHKRVSLLLSYQQRIFK